MGVEHEAKLDIAFHAIETSTYTVYKKSPRVINILKSLFREIIFFLGEKKLVVLSKHVKKKPQNIRHCQPISNRSIKKIGMASTCVL